MTTKTSFGKYFDDQRDRIVKDMQNKNAQQNIEWMERYEKRQEAKKKSVLFSCIQLCSEKRPDHRMIPVGPKEKKLLEEMIHETKAR